MGLRETRRRIEALAGDGRFHVASARTGEEPFPAAGLRFPDRETATAAARLTRRYRAALRRWDPELASTDPVVHEGRPTLAAIGRAPDGATAASAGGEP
ncbi:hypothetical protein ACFR97_13780 [Haloplanus litoreus]|uniref:DUF7552 domain-containing protein n=2 Tax=Haloplanus litoreus TaxID=767515 RepID=A0ABD5ZYV6_9EURY